MRLNFFFNLLLIITTISSLYLLILYIIINNIIFFIFFLLSPSMNYATSLLQSSSSMQLPRYLFISIFNRLLHIQVKEITLPPPNPAEVDMTFLLLNLDLKDESKNRFFPYKKEWWFIR